MNYHHHSCSPTEHAVYLRTILQFLLSYLECLLHLVISDIWVTSHPILNVLRILNFTSNSNLSATFHIFIREGLILLDILVHKWWEEVSTSLVLPLLSLR